MRSARKRVCGDDGRVCWCRWLSAVTAVWWWWWWCEGARLCVCACVRAGEYAGIPICLTKIREIQARQENARIREGIREVNATTAAIMIEQGAAMILPPPTPHPCLARGRAL